MEQLGPQDLINYIMAICTTLTAIITCITAVILAFKKFGKAIKKNEDETKSLKQQYKLLNKTCEAIMEENLQLKEIIKTQSENFELIKLELNTLNGKEE